MPEKMKAALEYAKLGFLVLPLKPGGKLPMTSHGVHDATTECQLIQRWWSYNPNCNIGLALGNGFICLDFDEDETKDKHGLETLRTWEMQHGKRLPDTWIHLTPRGGAHYIYRDPEGYRSNPKLYRDVELRSSGYYIVAPPSIRSDGKPYLWECGYSPEDMECASIDETVREFLIGEQSTKQSTGGSAERAAKHRDKFRLPERIYSGEREIVFMQLFGALYDIGLSEEAIRAAISIENELRFEPSWTDRELEKVIFPAFKREWDDPHPYWDRRNAYWELQRELRLKDRKIELLQQLVKLQESKMS